MEIRRALHDDALNLATLLWRFAGHDGRDAAGLRNFVGEVQLWWAHHPDTHLAFLAAPETGPPVGMAWLALTARAPRPANMSRMCGDLQSVYVLPEHRGDGIGSALVAAVLQCADETRLEHITVHANRAALSLYQRAGFVPDGELLVRSLREYAAGAGRPGRTVETDPCRGRGEA